MSTSASACISVLVPSRASRGAAPVRGAPAMPRRGRHAALKINASGSMLSGVPQAPPDPILVSITRRDRLTLHGLGPFPNPLTLILGQDSIRRIAFVGACHDSLASNQPAQCALCDFFCMFGGG